jgi:PhnB protein
MTSAKFIPDGYRTISPHLIVRDVRKAIAFCKAAFGAEQTALHLMPDGTAMHASIQIGDSAVLFAEESPAWKNLSPLTLGNSPVSLHMYVKDVDATFKQAVAAGATATMPPADMFWGDRYAKVVDPFGHHWSIATHQKDLTEAEIGKAAQEFFAKMAVGK